MMFFEIADGVKEIELERIDPERVTGGYISLQELETLYPRFGLSESTVEACRTSAEYYRATAEVRADHSFAVLKITDAANLREQEDCVAFYIKKNLLLVVDICDRDESTRRDYFRLLEQLMPAQMSLGLLAATFLNSLIEGDSQALERMEQKIEWLEELVLHDSWGDDFYRTLLHFKRDLLSLRNYYEQLIELCEELSANENGLIPESGLRHLRHFGRKTERLLANVNILRDSLVQLREAYQSALDLKLNGIMKVFTVIAAIFLPLTLITGWYGMNFTTMPELSWQMGYIYVIMLSVLVAGVCWVVFKRKKFM